MAITTNADLFQETIKKYNAAVAAKDVNAMCESGRLAIEIALRECSNPSCNQVLRDKYRKEVNAILANLEYFAKMPRTPVSASSGGEGSEAAEGGNDPYYTPKEWFSDEVPNLTFRDVIGADEVRDAFTVDVLAPLTPKFQPVYRRFRGDSMGTQVLLWGPPGTGKTHIVKCLAGSLHCKIAVVQTSEVLASVVGVAEKNIRDIFEQASKLDRCVIFFDEIDSICSDRSSDDSRHTKSILTTLLTCMDGFMKTTRDDQLRIIVAATNLPWKLDSALKRGGRFETQIYVPLPDLSSRRQFVEMALSKVPHAPDVTVDYLADQLEGYSGADIKAVMRQIANEPLRREVHNINSGVGEKGERITKLDCQKVLSKYINGITMEMLDHFEAYRLGITYEELLRRRLKEEDPKG